MIAAVRLALALQAAAAPSEPPVSLVVAGHWRGVAMVGQPPCPEHIPDGEECLSLNVIADVRLGNVRTLAGPTVPDVLTARFEFHANPARGYEQILLVRRSVVDRGRFDAISLGRARRGGRICVDRHALTAHRVPPPRHARIEGEEICLGR